MRQFTLRDIPGVAAAALLVIAAPQKLLAADAPAPASPAAPPLTDVLTASGISVSGYVAASYYHSSGYSSYHEFDIQHDTFQLDQAGVTVAYQPKEGFGALVNVIGGEDARIINASEQGLASSNSTFNVTQAFVQYVAGPFTVIGGKYVTLAGAEVIAPTGNTNFSRSLLFFAEPLTHTGIRATYAASDQVSLIAGVNNGWNTTSTSYGSKTGELGASFTPNKQFSLAAQAYLGKTPAFDAEKTLIDLVATYNATDTLTLILSYDWGKQEQNGLPNLQWNGLAGYVNYAINSLWRVSVRAEYLDDKDGLNTGTDQKLKEATVTFGFAPAKSFELRLEGRYDKSDKTTFLSSVTGPAPAFDDHQTGVALQGLFKV